MTAWTDFLANQGATLDNGIISFPNEATAETLAVPLTHLGMLQSVGPDSAPYLHNLFSNDVNKLGEAELQLNSFNSPKGRMLASILLWREGEGHDLIISADILPALHKKLSMYILRSKVKLGDLSAERALIGVTGPRAAAALQQAGLPVPEGLRSVAAAKGIQVLSLDANNYVVVVGAEQAASVFGSLDTAGAAPAGTHAWQLAMIRAGLPLVTLATQEEFVAQMLNYELIGGVSFKKGCYPGQEIVARTQHLGKVKKRMYRIALPAGCSAAAGTDLYSPAFGDQSAGKLVNIARLSDGSFEALAVLQTSCADAGEIHVGAPDGPLADLLGLPYALA